MFPTLQNASNETSASEMTLYVRENKGLRKTKKLQSAIYREFHNILVDYKHL
jgi:hypothetical protein